MLSLPCKYNLPILVQHSWELLNQYKNTQSPRINSVDSLREKEESLSIHRVSVMYWAYNLSDFKKYIWLITSHFLLLKSLILITRTFIALKRLTLPKAWICLLVLSVRSWFPQRNNYAKPVTWNTKCKVGTFYILFSVGREWRNIVISV